MVVTLQKRKSMGVPFGRWFKTRRTFLGLTQADIANELEVKPTAVGNWERGVSNPSLNPDQNNKLCKLLETNSADLAKAYRGELEIDF